MPIKIVDLNADFSAFANPKVEDRVKGFPLANLRALYLFEDGAVGSTPTQALDSSGNGRNAALTAGSSISRIAEGVKSGDALNNGFLFNAPVAYNASFSVVGVIRSRTPLSTSGSFPVLHGISAAYPTGAGGGYPGQAITNFGTLAVNHDNTSPNDLVNIAPYNLKAGGGTSPWTGSSVVRPNTPSVAPRTTWQAWAMSVDVVTGMVILRSNGGTVSFTSLSDLQAFVAQGGNHAFGYARYMSVNNIMGDMGLFGIYAGAKDAAGLDVLIASAKARMAMRGVAAA